MTENASEAEVALALGRNSVRYVKLGVARMVVVFTLCMVRLFNRMLTLRSLHAWLPHREPVHRAALIVLGAIVLAGSLLILIPSTRAFLTSPTALRDFVMRFGGIAPAAVVVYYIIQIILVPLPGQPLDVTVGYLYGPLFGSLLAAIGAFLGTTIAIGLARHYGHPFVRNFIAGRKLKHLETLLSHRSRWFFLVVFLIPGTPSDLLCLLIGLTRIPFWQAVVIANLGRLPTTIGGVLLGATGHSWSLLSLVALSFAVFLLFFIVSQLLPRRWKVFR